MWSNSISAKESQIICMSALAVERKEEFVKSPSQGSGF